MVEVREFPHALEVGKVWPNAPVPELGDAGLAGEVGVCHHSCRWKQQQVAQHDRLKVGHDRVSPADRACR